MKKFGIILVASLTMAVWSIPSFADSKSTSHSSDSKKAGQSNPDCDEVADKTDAKPDQASGDSAPDHKSKSQGAHTTQKGD